LRRQFLLEFLRGLRIVWPIISGLLAFMGLLGAVIGWQEGWSLGESVYFAFVSGLTIGYGDLAPSEPLSRVLAIVIGATGILLTGLIAAVGVRALELATRH
jgi:hypothetical protein